MTTLRDHADASASPRVDALPLSNRTKCRLVEAGIETVAELDAKTDAELLALDGFGHTCLREVRSVLRFLGDEATTQQPVSDRFPVDVDEELATTPLAHLPISNRARRVFEREQIVTVRDYLQRGEDHLLHLRNFGETSLRLVNRAIHAAAERDTTAPPLPELDKIGDSTALGDALSHVPVSALDLPRRARRVCQELGLRTLRDLARVSGDDLLTRKNFGQATLRRIREEVDHFLALHERGAEVTFVDLLDSLFQRLQSKERQLVELRENRDGSGGKTLIEAGTALGITESRACQIEHSAWARLRRFSAGLTDGAGKRAAEFILRQGGVCSADDLATDAFFAPTRTNADFVARLLSRLVPHQVGQLPDGRLAALPAATLTTLGARLKKRLLRTARTMPLQRLTDEVLRGLDAGEHGPTIVRALCETLFHREVSATPEGEEQVRTSAQGLGDDLSRVLVEAGKPLHFRDIARKLTQPPCSRGDVDEEKVRLRLCRDPRFVLIRRGLYDLRERFHIEPERRAELATRSRAILLEAGRPTSVALIAGELARDPRFEQLSEFALAAILRDDAGFRHLGRGTFVVAEDTERSVLHVSEMLERFLLDAGGPLSYAELRRLVRERRQVSDGAISATLVGRDTFIRVERGLFDLAQRHPFGPSVRAALVKAAKTLLEAEGGVVSVDKVGAAVRGTLPGFDTTLHPVLIGDLLRRSGDFQFLGSGFIALNDTTLEATLRRRAYELLRSVGEPLRPTTIARRLSLGSGAALLLKRLLKDSAQFNTLPDGRFSAKRTP